MALAGAAQAQAAQVRRACEVFRPGAPSRPPRLVHTAEVAESWRISAISPIKGLINAKNGATSGSR